MQEKKPIPTAERASLLETLCGKMDWSMNTHDEMFKVIKNTGLKLGSEASEAKAKEIRLMIEAGTSETDILDALKTM